MPTEDNESASKYVTDNVTLAQTVPHGPPSEISSVLLTPTTIDPWDRSPPPKPEADDYFDTQGRFNHGQRHQARGRAKRSTYSRDYSQSSIHSQILAAENASQSDIHDSGSLSPTTFSKDLSRISSHRQGTSSPRYETPIRSKTLSPNAAFGSTALRTASPATTALRRLSLSKKKHHGRGQRRKRTSNDRLETPDSITVRKASSAHHFNNALSNTMSGFPSNDAKVRPSGKQPQMAPPSVELVAFYSEHRPQAVGHYSSSGAIEPIAKMNDSRKNSVSQSSPFYNGRRQSKIADLAVTFADVHVALGTFSVDEASRRESISFQDVSPRVSAVQFRSRNSVHEVIWREDEMSSPSSVSSRSHGSSSPDGRSQFQTISALHPDNENSTDQLSRSSVQQGMGIPFMNSEQQLSADQTKASIFSFPWGKSVEGLDPTVKSDMNGSGKGSMRSSTGACSHSSAHVSFSPSGRALESNSDQCRTPIVDVDTHPGNSEGGRSPREHRRTLSKQNLKELNEENSSARGANDHSCNSPCLWEPGKTGSRLGVSSHQSRILH